MDFHIPIFKKILCNAISVFMFTGLSSRVESLIFVLTSPPFSNHYLYTGSFVSL